MLHTVSPPSTHRRAGLVVAGMLVSSLLGSSPSASAQAAVAPPFDWNRSQRHNGTIAGVVIDDVGHPVPHARVRVWEDRRFEVESLRDHRPEPPSRTIESDEAGAFSVNGLWVYAMLEAAAPGMAPLQCLEGELRANEVASGRRLRLTHASSIRGRVIGTAGTPAINWVVTACKAPWEIPYAGLVSAPPLAVQTRTDSDGRFVLEPLSPGAWWVCCEETATGSWAGWVEAGGPSLDIRLEPPFTVPSTVVGADGSPTPHARLVVAGTSLTSWHALAYQVRLETDDSGHGLIPALMEADDADVVIAAPGCELATWHDVQLRRTQSPLEFRLQPELIISGTVVDDAELPVSGAELFFDRLSDDGGSVVDMPWANQVQARWTKCDAQGRFTLHHLGAADYLITIRGPDTPVGQSYAIVAAGSTDLRLRQFGDDTDLVTINGKFTEALTGQWMYSAFVYLEAVDSRPLPRGALMPGGSFSQFESEYSIVGAPPGRYRLCASEVGTEHARWKGPPTDFKAGRYEIDIGLHPARTLALRVSTPAGAPVAGAAVRFTTQEGEPLAIDSEPQGDGTIGITDRYGEIVGTRLPAVIVGVLVTLPARSEPASATALDPVFIDLASQDGSVVEIAVPATSGR